MTGEKSKKNTKKKKAFIRRGEVFKAMLEIISEGGMSSLSTTKIAKKMGITQPALYRYFKNRDEMFLLFFEELKSKLLDIVKKAKKEKTLNGKIKTLLNYHFQFMKETKAIPSIVFSGYLFEGDEEKKSKVREVMGFYRSEIENMFREGNFPEKLLPLSSDFTVGALMSFVLRWLYDEDFDFEKNLEVVDEYVSILLESNDGDGDISSIMI